MMPQGEINFILSKEESVDWKSSCAEGQGEKEGPEMEPEWFQFQAISSMVCAGGRRPPNTGSIPLCL